MKRLISIILAVAMTFVVIATPISAVSGDNDGTGAEGGYTNVGGSTWDTYQQGYRFCLVAEDGTPVSNAVDILFSKYPSNTETYGKSRTGGTRSQILLWSDVGITPPYAVKWSGGPIGNGAAFKSWFLSGNNAEKVLNYRLKSGAYAFTFLSSADKTLVSNGKDIEDICAQKNYYITAEPITWFVPAAWNSNTNSISTNNYGKYIYGTIYNICGWYKNHSGYGTGGGAYSNVLGVMWQSMYTVSSLITLVNPMSAVKGTTEAQIEAFADTNPTLAAVYDKLSSGFGTAIHVYYLGNVAADEGEKPEDEISAVGTDTKSYPKSTTVITSVNLKATSDNITSLKPATVTFIVNNKTFTVNNVVIPKGEEQLVWIKWTTPDAVGTYPMTVQTSQGAIENPNSTSSADAYVSTLNVGVTINNGITEVEPPDPTALDKAQNFGYTKNASASAYTNLQKAATNSTTHSWTVWSCRIEMTAGKTYPTYSTYVTSSSSISSTKQTLINQGYNIVSTDTNPTSVYVKSGYYKSQTYRWGGGTSHSYLYSYYRTSGGYTDDGGTIYTSCSVYDGVYNGKNVVYVSLSGGPWVDSGYWQDRYYIYYKLPDEPEVVTPIYSKTTFTTTVKAPVIEISPSVYCENDYTLGNKTYIKSGYGTYIDAAVNLVMTSSSGSSVTIAAGNSISAVVGFQKALTYFPEFCYSTYRRLLNLSENTFSYRTNKYSGLGDNSHFTPIWYPDNLDWQPLTSFFYAYTPVGVMRLSYVPSDNAITILGNVYDDWHITHR